MPANGIEPASGIEIDVDSPLRGDVLALLEQHLADMRATSPPQSVHALDPDALSAATITFFTAREGGALLGCGALSDLRGTKLRGTELRGTDLRGTEGEIKSMRTTPSARGRGVASLLLQRILDVAAHRGYVAVSLETGVEDYFSAARALYSRFGFTECAPFAGYTDDPNSAYFRINLA